MAPSYNNGRRGPNVSHFLRDLNAMQDKPHDEPEFTFEDDLAIFTNTNFFDFDSGQNTDYQAPPVKPDFDASAAATPVTSQMNNTADDLTSSLGDLTNLEFMSSDFNFGDFNTYHGSGVPHFHESLGNLQPLQPNPQPSYAPAVPQQQPQQPQQHAYVQPHAAPHAGEKAKAPLLNKPSRPMPSYEEESRVAAEEDKRRRNTAASARFRVKKKQREQALEQSAKEMSDKVTQLESRINLLETENRWLKNLVMEKNDGKEEISAMLKEFDSKHKAGRAAGVGSSLDGVKDEK